MTNDLTSNRGSSSVGRALASQAEGREFESRLSLLLSKKSPPQYKKEKRQKSLPIFGVFLFSALFFSKNYMP